MTDDQITDRLRNMGQQPIDPATQSAHLTALASTRTVSPLRHKLQVAGALLAGLLIGGTGLAAAGALPDTAQQAAHTTLARVGLKVPKGHDRVTEGCDTDANGDPYKNHGQYVKAHKDDPDASKSDCGKPKVSVHDDTSTGDAPNTECPTPDPTGAVNEHGQGKADPQGAAKAKSKAAKGCSEDHPDSDTNPSAGHPDGDVNPGDDAPGADAGSAGDEPPTSTTVTPTTEAPNGPPEQTPPADTPPS